MFSKLFRTTTFLAAALLAGPAFAASWSLDGESSHLAFGSVKKEKVGEVHSFSALTGAVTAAGNVNIEIGLNTVETWIDIRNERINEHVFGGEALATLTTQIDMDELTAMTAGSTSVIDVEATLSFLGQEVPLEAEMFVVRVSENKAIVSTNDMIFLTTEDLGIDAGIDTLMKLAKLPGITRATPVTMRMVFNLDDQKAQAN